MIDVNVAVRTWLLLGQRTLQDGTTQVNQIPVLLNSLFKTGGAAPNDTPNRVYGGHLIPGFDAQYGPGIVVRVGSGTETGTGGGSAHPEIPLISPRTQLSVFADVQQYDIARRLYRAAWDWMHGSCNIELGNDDQGEHIGYIMSCIEQVEGQDVDDPHTHTATNISYWKLMLRAI